MLDLFFYYLLCILLACNSFQDKIRAILRDYYRLAQPLMLEKLLFYLLMEAGKIIIIINAGSLVTDFILVPILGLLIYLIMYSLIWNCSDACFVFSLWAITAIFHPQAFQLSLAQFISCYILLKNRPIANLVTVMLVPINLIGTSANLCLIIFSILILVLQGLKYFSHETLNNFFKSCHLFFRLQ